MKRSAWQILCLLLTLTILFSACGSNLNNGNVSDDNDATKDNEIRYKDTLVVGISTEPVSLDNHSDADTASLLGIDMVYDNLIGRDPETGELIPMLAESWEFVDDLTLVFKLRQDVKDHKGNQFTAADVKFSIDRQKELLRAAGDVETVDSVEVVDEYTVQFNLNTPSVPLLTLLSDNPSSIQSSHCLDSGEWECVGTGPYILTDWQAGDSMTFTRNENYWGGVPETETIIFRLIPEDSSRLIALETGEIDICQNVKATDKNKIAENPELMLFEAPSNGVEYVVLNCAEGPFANMKVRQALSAATNREELVQAVFQGNGVVNNSILGPGVIYHCDVSDHAFDYDIENAKKLLEEAGYGDGFSFTMLVKGSQQQLTAQVLQAQYAEVGITMDIQFAENTAFFDALNRGDFDAGMITLSNTSGEPIAQCDKLYSVNFGSAGNRGKWKNERYDELYLASFAETDTEKRAEIFKEMQEIVAEENPFIMMMCAELYTGAVKGMEGYVQGGSNHACYVDIRLPIDS